MVAFDLTDEQQALRQLAREFSEKEIRPYAASYDKSGQWPKDIVKKAWELGLLNSHIPQDLGGLSLGCLEDCLIGEEFAWGCTGISLAMTASGLAQTPVLLVGTKEQKKKWLSPFMSDLMFASYCVTEPDAGSDVSSIKTTAVKKVINML